MKSAEEYVLFVGNPGGGKSTLLNSLLGKLHFKSGVSFGQGLTTLFDSSVQDGVTFCDTPGLLDTALRQQAAEEITKALKQDGVYRIFFVVTLEAGRGSSK